MFLDFYFYALFGACVGEMSGVGFDPWLAIGPSI